MLTGDDRAKCDQLYRAGLEAMKADYDASIIEYNRMKARVSFLRTGIYAISGLLLVDVESKYELQERRFEVKPADQQGRRP